MIEINIDMFLEGLKYGKTDKTQQSPVTLNETLRSGERDFSITTIGLVSAEDGGVSYESIRATANKHYRHLIEAWKTKTKTTTKKPLSKQSRSHRAPQDNQLLERIPGPALRVLFGKIIAERNLYRTEVNILKNQAEVVIDRRPVMAFEAPVEPLVELIPSLKGIVSDNEIKALKYTDSKKCIECQGWRITKAGQVKTDLGEESFLAGS